MLRKIKLTFSRGVKRLLPKRLYQRLLLERFYRWRLPKQRYQMMREHWYKANYEGEIIRIKGLSYVLHPKERISRAFFRNEVYAPSIVQTLISLGKLCNSFIDVGANIGLIAVQVGKKTHLPTLAIEPSHANFQLLTQNINSNLTKAQSLRVALSNEVARMDLILAKNDSGSHRLRLDSDESPFSEEVEVTKLDNLLDIHHELTPPYLIKIDVQGREWHLLKGAERSLKKESIILLRLAPFALQETGSSLKLLDDVRHSYGLSAYWLQTNPQLSLVQVESLDEIFTMLAPRWGGDAWFVLTNMNLATSDLLPIISSETLQAPHDLKLAGLAPDKIFTLGYNVFHCCVQKTASQWLRAIFADERIFEASGLMTHYMADKTPEEIPLPERKYENKVPANRIISPLYLGYRSFQSIAKNDLYRSFFVMRDPRDIVVSWYYSALYSHELIGDLGELRSILSNNSLDYGLIHAIDYCQKSGIFAAMREWKTLGAENPDVMIVKYEDLISENKYEEFKALFQHCFIGISENTLADLLEDYSFEKMSKGRNRGVEDPQNHYRKGVAGDWQNHFSEHVKSHFKHVTQDLIDELGYLW